MQIIMTEQERLLYEYYWYAYKGLQINFEQCVNGDYKYNEEMFNRLIEEITNRYAALQKHIYLILKDHGYKNIKINSIDYYVSEGTLHFKTG